MGVFNLGTQNSMLKHSFGISCGEHGKNHLKMEAKYINNQNTEEDANNDIFKATRGNC